MTRAEAKIEIIIPNWNGKQLLVECLNSLRNQTSQEFSVTVVDNGSADGSVELIRDYFPEVKLIPFASNKGFSVAVNEGIRNRSAEWVFLLNNDIEVAEDCIREILSAIEKYREYDFFSLRMMSYHHRDVFDGAGDAVMRGGVGYRVGTQEKGGQKYMHDRDVFGACAGAAIYSSRFFEDVGVFDEDFFAYLEDVDLNMRAVHRGFRCRYLADAVVYHIGSATTGSKINPMTIRLSTKNNINVILKNYPASLLLRMSPAICVYQLMWFLFVCKKKMVIPYFQGIVAALKQVRPMLAKRRDLLEQRKIPTVLFHQALKASEREAVRSIMDRRSEEGKGNAVLNLYCRLFL